MKYIAVLVGLTFATLACGGSAEPTPAPTTLVPTPFVITPTAEPTPSEPEATSVPAENVVAELPDTGPFEDVSQKLDFVREGIYHNSDGLGGAAWFDYDGDLDLDLYITNAKEVDNALFRDNGDGTFTNVTQEAGVASGTGNAAVVAGDIDNNGCPDLLVAGDGGLFATKSSPFKVYMNNCDGTFEDTTESAGLSKVQASLSLGLGDIDNDGFLDLFVGGMPGPGFNFGIHRKLYRNDGDGTFTDISLAAGIDNDLPSCGVGFSDYDEDGWTDIYIASCAWLDARFQLLRNNGDQTFSDVALDAGLSAFEEGSSTRFQQDWHIGVAFEDYDLDGDLDLLSLGQSGSAWEKGGDGKYTPLEWAMNAGEASWGLSLADFDNDGYPDVFLVGGYPVGQYPTTGLPGTVYENNGDRTISSVAEFGLQDRFVTGVATGDYDNDGFPDLLIVVTEDRGEGGQAILLHNRGNDNGWITVKTVGTASNLDGVGARVTVSTADLIHVQEVRAGSPLLSSNSPWLTFGLAQHAGPVDIEVRWPSGLTEVFEKQPIRQIVTLTEGTGATR